MCISFFELKRLTTLYATLRSIRFLLDPFSSIPNSSYFNDIMFLFSIFISHTEELKLIELTQPEGHLETLDNSKDYKLDRIIQALANIVFESISL